MEPTEPKPQHRYPPKRTPRADSAQAEHTDHQQAHDWPHNPTTTSQTATQTRRPIAIDLAPEVLNTLQSQQAHPLSLRNRKKPTETARPLSTEGYKARAGRRPRALEPGDLSHADTVIAARRREVSRLSLDGYSIREIADALGVSDATVAADRKWALEQAQALATASVEALRQQSSERLEQSRTQLLSIARGEPQPRWSCRQGATDENGNPVERKRLPDALPTIADQTAALRQLARVEEQRASLLGLSARGEFGKLGDWLDDLAKRRDDGPDPEAIEVEPVRTPSQSAALDARALPPVANPPQTDQPGTPDPA